MRSPKSTNSAEAKVPYSLDVLRLPQPCSERWESMPGGPGVRLCGACNKQIHNLSALTRADAEALLSRPEGPPCVTFTRRPDGTIVTADRVGPWNRIAAWIGRAAAFFALGWAVAGCADKSKTDNQPVGMAPIYERPQPVGMVPPQHPVASPPSTAPTTEPGK